MENCQTSKKRTFDSISDSTKKNDRSEKALKIFRKIQKLDVKRHARGWAGDEKLIWTEAVKKLLNQLEADWLLPISSEKDVCARPECTKEAESPCKECLDEGRDLCYFCKECIGEHVHEDDEDDE